MEGKGEKRKRQHSVGTQGDVASVVDVDTEVKNASLTAALATNIIETCLNRSQ